LSSFRTQLIGLVAAGFLVVPAFGQGVLSVQPLTGSNLIVDSNVSSPATYAPRSGYIGANFCNTGNATLQNVFANVGNYNGGVNSTPGVFPVWNSAAPTAPTPIAPAQLANTGNYSL